MTDDDDIAKALADSQRGPKGEPLSEAEIDARANALRRFFAARLAYLHEAHLPRRVCHDCGMSGTGRCRRHDDEREL